MASTCEPPGPVTISLRKGTPAAEMGEQVEKHVKVERGKELALLETELRNDYFGRLVGEPLQLMVERSESNVATGTSCRYARVQVPDSTATESSLISVRISRAEPDFLVARES